VRKTLLAFWLTFLITLTVSLFSHSATLISEALHSLFDAIIVSLSFHLSKLISRKDTMYTYGFHRIEVFSSLLNIITVLVGSAVALYISLVFLLNHVRDNPLLLSIASFLAFTLFALASNEEEGKEMGTRLHLIQDGIAYLIGGASGLLILFTKEYFIDPLSSFIILAIIILTSIGSLKTSFNIIMEKSPVDVCEIEEELKNVLPEVHHIHVWTLCEHVKVATLHVLTDPHKTLKELDETREKAEKILRDKFNINHVTIQFESKKEEENEAH